jgi:hypothetical protein
MTNPMSCDQFAGGLSALLEREVDEPTRASLEAHAIACAECGSLLADLRKLRVDAANLPELTPSRDLWAGIESRIQTPVIELQGMHGPSSGVSRADERSRRRISGSVWMGLAAAGLVAVTAGITHVMTKRVLASKAAVVATQSPSVSPVAAPATVAPKTDSTQPAARDASSSARPATTAAAVASGPVDRQTAPGTTRQASFAAEKSLSAEQTYALEIARLRVIVNRRRAQLDPVTIGVIDRNLQLIDDAITQIKQALSKDPASRFLIESLNSALENKVEVHRTAATLPTRT